MRKRLVSHTSYQVVNNTQSKFVGSILQMNEELDVSITTLAYS